MSPPAVLVVGATGTQGGAVIRALLADPSTPADLTILALTRNTTSPRAIGLSKTDSRIILLAGDSSTPNPIFTSTPHKITTVFCVTVHGAAGVEEAQAQALINASLSHGVQHFIFTSADRGGALVSDTNPTPVPHIATKHRIEIYLRGITEGTAMKWTILRPVTFMDNLTSDFKGKGFAAMWNQVGTKPVQLVAASDIGFFAAKAILNPGEYAGRKIGIAGDELNFEDACKVFRERMGKELPTTFCVVGTLVKVVDGDLGAMFKWFEKDGFAVDIKAAKEENPRLMDFETWLERESGFRKM